jgi:benzoate-CoA ligase family protein
VNAAADILRAGDDGSVAIRLRADTRRLDVTRGALRHRVRQTASALAALGVEAGQRVLVILPDSPDLVYAFLGTMWNGGVPVVLNSFLHPDAYASILQEAGARAVVTTEPVAEALRHVATSLERAAGVLTVAPDGGGSFTAAITAQSGTADPFPARPDDPAFWLYSSGTTGRPKGVVHAHRAIAHAVASYGQGILALRGDDVAYATSKLFFAYGLGAGLYFPLAAGGTSVLSPEPYTPARTWRILADETPSLFFAVPSAYRTLLESAPAGAATALACVRRCISAGEALPDIIFHEWKRRFGIEILDGLGSTEAVHIFLSNRPDACVPGTLGCAVPGYEVRIVDELGSAVAAGTPGTLRVRGASIATGYWQHPEATQRAFVGGWFVTGDQAVESAAGTFRLLGRSDDLLKVSGQWVTPVEIEGVIAAVAGVRECAVVGTPNTSGLTELVACVARDPAGGEDLRARIEAACRAALPRFKQPKRILFLEALPRTATGKVQRFALREQSAIR